MRNETFVSKYTEISVRKSELGSFVTRVPLYRAVIHRECSMTTVSFDTVNEIMLENRQY